jgi:WD40 repeat protein/uncharacterized caspase-like protein
MRQGLRAWTASIIGALAVSVATSGQCQAPVPARIVLPTPHSLTITGIARLIGLGLVASAGMDGRVKIWEEQSGLLVSEIESKGFAPIAGLASDPSGSGRIAVSTLNASEHPAAISGGQSTIRLVELSTGKTVAQFPGQAGHLRFSPTGQWLTSSAHSLLSVWNARTGRHHVTLQVDAAWADFAGPDTVVFRRKDRVVILDLNSGTTRTIATGRGSVFAVSKDGTLVADIGDQELRIWKVADGTSIAKRPLMSRPEFIYFSQDGSVVAAGNNGLVWEGQARNLIYRFKAGDWTMEGLTVGNSPMTMVADGGDSILVGQRNGRIQRLVLNEKWRRFNSLGVDADDISAVAYSPDGRYLAGGFSAGGAVVWEPTSNWYRVLDPLNKVRTPPQPGFTDIEKQEHYSSTYVAGEGVTNAKEIGRERVIGLAFLGPEVLLIAHQNGAAEVVNVTDGKVLTKITTQEPLSVIGGNATRVAILGRRGVTFIESAGFATKVVPLANAGTRHAAFNPSGDRLVVHGYEATVELDAVRGTELSRSKAMPGVPIFMEDGSLTRLAWRVAPDAADPEGAEDSPKAFSWSALDSIGVLAKDTGQVRIWSKNGRRFAARDFTIGGSINDAALSPDGGTLAIGSGHGRIALYRAKDGAFLADLASHDRRGWLARDAFNGFDGSHTAWDKLRATQPANALIAIEPANFFAAAYRPQLVADVMKELAPESLALSGKSLQRKPPILRITEPAANYFREAAPHSASTLALNNERRLDDKGKAVTFEFIAPNQANTQVRGTQAFEEASVLFRAEVRSAGDGIGECRIFRNRRLLQTTTPKASRDGIAEIRTTLPLREGDNALSAYCFSGSGLRSQEVEVRIFGADKLKTERYAYLLVVGINEYSLKDTKLRYAVPDAKLAREKLESSLGATGQYAAIRPALLLDGNATAANILKGLGILAGSEAAVTQGPLAALKKSAPSDTVFVYFAGHGGGFAKDYRLIASDGTVGKEVTQGTVSATQIRDTLEPLQADRAVIIIDACESGQALDQVDARAGPLAGRSLAQLAYDKAIFVISASQSREAAIELQRLGHGVFSWVLFDRGFEAAADENRDGFTTIREWLAFAQSETPKEVDKGLAELDKTLQRTKTRKPATTRSTFADEALNRAQTPRVFIPDPELAREFVIARPEKKTQ